MKYFYKEEFEKAQPLFEEIEENGHYKDSEYRLEISKLVQRKYREEPLDVVLTYRNTKSISDKFYYYWMGRIYANRYMFPEAQEAWNRFLNSKAYKSEVITKETEQFFTSARLRSSFFDNTDDYEIHRLESPVNSEFTELSPAYFADFNELLYTSNRDNPESQEFDIYHAISKEGEWTSNSKLEVLGTLKRKNSNLEVVNDDGKLFIFKDKKGGDLYFSEESANGWAEPKEFDSKITSTKLESHFHINAHEDRIIFASYDRKRGLELMESFFNPENGKWETPHSISGQINTLANEDSPFLSHDEKKLYFSSDRLGGLGGFDVYVSEFDEETKSWGEPSNMGWPINSPDDEYHFKMNPDGKSGYFSSNRIHSIGDFDIFYFWNIEKTSIEGRVINALTGELVKGAEIRFMPSKYLDEYFRSPIDSAGKYHTKIISNEVFQVRIIRNFDTLHQETFEIHDAKGESIKHFKDFYIYPKEMDEMQIDSVQLALQKTKASLSPGNEPPSNAVPSKVNNPEKQMSGSNLEIKGNTSPRQARIESYISSPLKNIYFDFGSTTMTPASLPRLEELYAFMSNGTSKIEIRGHTDNIGSPQTNMLLSKLRAERLKKWLVNHGVDGNRILTKGLGEGRPMASNDDETEGRELNRRIEILVID